MVKRPLGRAIACAVICAFFVVTYAGTAHGAAIISTHVPRITKSLQPIGTLPGTNQLHLTIALPLRNQSALSALLHDLYDPRSPYFRHFLTPGQFTEQFGPATADYAALHAFAESNHFRINGIHPNRLLLDVTASAADVQRAFHVTLQTFQHPTENRIFFAPDREPTSDLPVPILHITGLDDYALPRPRLTSIRPANVPGALPNSGSGPNGTYMGSDFRAAYLPGVTLNGAGQVVGLLELDGYNASDITYYENKNGLSGVPLTNVLINGSSGGPTGNGDVEVCLDIEVAISMAPAMSNLVVYIAPNDSNPFLTIFNRMATDDLAKQISCSWYVPGGGAEPAADAIWQEMAAQGQSFFNASGDSDAWTGLISFPGDSPYITQAGGTTLTTTGPGGAWSSETVWNWGIEFGSEYNGVGSSGGISTQYSIPSYQTNISMALNQGSTTMRNTPDVAMTADNVYVRADNYDYSVGGTSCAAPLWAGFMALVNQEAVASGKSTVGFVNPMLDAIGTGPNYSNAFHDITNGNNTWRESTNRFFAVAGYDLCTGWGTPAGQPLIDAIANPEPLSITPPSGFTSAGGSGGPFTIVAEDFYLTNNGTNLLNWTVSDVPSWLNVSPTNGSLATNSPATVVTVILNAAASNLLVGSYSATVWFTNLSDNFGQSRQFNLNIVSPPAITSQPTEQDVIEGAPAQFSVSATGGLPLSYQWQLNGTNLADDGNVSGSATSNLTIAAVSDDDVGTYTVIVTNVAGAVTSSNALLTIIPSAPVITVQPTNETVFEGVTARFFVSVIGNTPFSFQWSFNGTNIADATNDLLVLTNAQFSEAGAYSVAISNSIGSTNSIPVALTVNPPPPCLPPPAGIVSWWPAEGNANDIVGTNNGVLVSDTSYAPGMVGQAFNFQQNGDWVAAPTGGLPVGTSDRTMECWVYINSFAPGAETAFAGYGNFGANGEIYYFGAYADTHQFFFSQWGNSFVGPVLTTNQWYHVAVTSMGTNLITLYLDGTNVATGNLSFSTPSNNTTLYIGGVSAPYITRQLIGEVDELAIYDRALASNEIAAIYNAGASGKCSSPTAPVVFTQPDGTNASVGDTVFLAVIAGGTAALNYQWSFNGTNIPGATNYIYFFANAQTTNTGTYAVLVTNDFGAAMSSNAFVSVTGVPPFITLQPTNETTQVACTTGFNVSAGGTAPLAYQWTFNSTNIAGATNSALALTDVQTNQAGTYAVSITNEFGVTNSSNATLTVLSFPPAITNQPLSQTVLAGTTVTLSVGASGSPPLFYQWTFGGTNISGATNDELTLTNAQLNEAGAYQATVSNAFGFTNSSIASLTVNPLPPCVAAPSGIIGWWPAEDSANDVVSTNEGVLAGTAGYTNGIDGQAFVFRQSGDQVVIPTAGFPIGTSDRTMECWVYINEFIPDAETDFAGYGSYGNAGEIYHIGATTAQQFFFSQWGQSIVGPNLTTNQWYHLAVTSQGTNVISLYINGTNVAHGSLPFDTPSGTILYVGGVSAPFIERQLIGRVDELSIYNRALSASEIANIYNAGSAGKCPLPPVILAQPANQAVPPATTATFCVGASGATPLAFQWSFNGTNIAGATNSTLTLTNVQSSQVGVYAIAITNNVGSVTSSNALLTFTGPPVVITQPASQTNVVGSNVVFSVTASGSAPLTYQWYFNSTNVIANATNVSLTLANLQFSEAGSYSVLVSNLSGSVFSSNAALVVNPLLSFVWNPISSPQFVNMPFSVIIQAENPTNNQLATNFSGTVTLQTTNGLPVAPSVSGNFSRGVWSGEVTISQPVTNLVLESTDSYDETGIANSISVFAPPTLATASLGGTLYITWPTSPSGFILQTSPNLEPGSWIPVNAPPVQIGNQYLEPITLAPTNAFYRLIFDGP